MDIGAFGAEFLGTFVLVIAILATADPVYITAAFLASITIISKISGGHINPAVSFAMFMNGTLSKEKLLTFVPAQVLGAVTAYFAYKKIYMNRV
jgi:aquaporin Z